MPVIPKGADWRIGFFDGYIESDLRKVGGMTLGICSFNVEKEIGVVRVEV